MEDTETRDMIDLAALDAAGFDALYAEKIEPLLKEFEAPRLKALATFKQRLWIGGALGILVVTGTFMIFRSGFAAFMTGAFSAAIVVAIAYTPLGKLAGKVKQAVLDLIAKAIGVSYTLNGFTPPAFERFRALSLAPSYDRSTFEDYFHGERHGCSFDLYEGHLETETRDKDGDTSWSTVFRGQLIRVSFPKPFLGTTIVRRDAGIFNALQNFGTKLHPIGLADPKFERLFQVYGSDQVEARTLIHPVFMERLLEIERVYEGKKLRCAFEAGDLLVAIEGGNKFETGGMFTTIADPERARRILRDLAQILKLMDAVLTAESVHLLGRK